MATRSIIAMKTKEGIKSIYSHWDGYPDHHYPILFNNYNTTEKVEELISLGDLSVLEDTIDGTQFYMRDRGEDECEAIDGKSVRETNRGHEEYLYFWNGSRWIVYETYGNVRAITSKCKKFL